MALFPEPMALLKYTIRKPQTLLPLDRSRAWQDMLVLESSEFLSAYRDYYVQTEFGLFNADTDELVHTISSRFNEILMITDPTDMPPAGNYFIRSRHQSDVSDWSAWSKPVKIKLYAARKLFQYSRKGFDEAEFDFLGFHPVRFGFDGAKLSAGFDSASFTTELSGRKYYVD